VSAITSGGYFEAGASSLNRATRLSALTAGAKAKTGRDALGRPVDVGDNLADFGATLNAAGGLSAFPPTRMSCSLPRLEPYPVRRKTEAIAGQIELLNLIPCGSLLR